MVLAGFGLLRARVAPDEGPGAVSPSARGEMTSREDDAGPVVRGGSCTLRPAALSEGCLKHEASMRPVRRLAAARCDGREPCARSRWLCTSSSSPLHAHIPASRLASRGAAVSRYRNGNRSRHTETHWCLPAALLAGDSAHEERPVRLSTLLRVGEERR